MKRDRWYSDRAPWTVIKPAEWQPNTGKMKGLTISVINTKSLTAEDRNVVASKVLPPPLQFISKKQKVKIIWCWWFESCAAYNQKQNKKNKGEKKKSRKGGIVYFCSSFLMRFWQISKVFAFLKEATFWSAYVDLKYSEPFDWDPTPPALMPQSLQPSRGESVHVHGHRATEGHAGSKQHIVVLPVKSKL